MLVYIVKLLKLFCFSVCYRPGEIDEHENIFVDLGRKQRKLVPVLEFD